MTEMLMLADREVLSRALSRKRDAELILAFVTDHLKESYDLKPGDEIEEDGRILRARDQVPVWGGSMDREQLDALAQAEVLARTWDRTDWFFPNEPSNAK